MTFKQGQLNPMWVGDDIGYNGVHNWIRRYLPKPELCQICNKNPSQDLSNISREYKRDLSDWEYLCRSCHFIKDKSPGYQICSICGTDKTYMKKRKFAVTPMWYYITNKPVCNRCHDRDYYQRKKGFES